jgi:hypothetical protein
MPTPTTWSRGKGTDAETQRDRPADVEQVRDDVDVHRRSGVAGPLQRARADEGDVAGGRGGEDDGEVRAAYPGDLRGRTENRDGELPQKEAEQDERNPGERADEDGLRDGLVAVGRGVASRVSVGLVVGGSGRLRRAGVLTGERDGSAAQSEADSQGESGVEVRKSDGRDCGGREQAGDDDVGGPHQGSEYLLGHHRPRQREDPPPDREQANPDGFGHGNDVL